MKEEFKEIAAYEPEDYLEQRDKLLQEPTFQKTIEGICSQILHGSINAQVIYQSIKQTENLEQWDQVILYPLMNWVVKNTSKGICLNGKEYLTSNPSNAVYITNHRDILLDSTLLSTLIYNQLHTRPYIGIGTNLYVEPWIERIVRLNKAFSVRRGGLPRQVLRNSQLLSQYINYLVVENQQSIWIAQREGRAKNSDDRTQPALLKMLTMAGEGDFINRLLCLNLTPVSLSYEYDPCDYLKAMEMQLKRDNPQYKKTPQDDYINMQTGMLGYKGQIVFTITPTINCEVAEIRNTTNIRNEQAEAVSNIIDKHIHAHYHIFTVNKIAYDKLFNTSTFEKDYSEAQKADFEHYLEGQINKINIPDKDIDFLYQRILEMYANPLKNQLQATK